MRTPEREPRNTRGPAAPRGPAPPRGAAASRGAAVPRGSVAPKGPAAPRNPNAPRNPRAPRELAKALSADFDDDDDFGDDEDGERDSLTDVPGGARLQKVMAEAGVGSRRYCEELIGAGRVEVDGETVRRFGARVDPDYQVIRVDGKRIPAKPGLAYLAFNKPPKVLTAMSDPRGRKTVADYLGDRSERLFHIGRLDYDTEGLMLLTNDGELAHRLAHPSFEVAKTYLADVSGQVQRDLGRRLMAGIELDDGVAAADKFRVIDRSGQRALVEITLHEGRKHVVRRMLAAAGHPVTRLVRTDVGPIKLGNLKPGTSRSLSTREIGELYAAVGL